MHNNNNKKKLQNCQTKSLINVRKFVKKIANARKTQMQKKSKRKAKTCNLKRKTEVTDNEIAVVMMKMLNNICILFFLVFVVLFTEIINV